MYKKVGEICHESRIAILEKAESKEYKVVKGPDVDYMTYREAIDDVKSQKLIWPHEDIYSASYFMIPAGGVIKKHSDGYGRNQDIRGEYSTYHIPLKNNDRCVNRVWIDEDNYIDQNLELGVVYKFDTMQQHQSFNLGKTDRIHLVVEAYD